MTNTAGMAVHSVCKKESMASEIRDKLLQECSPSGDSLSEITRPASGSPLAAGSIPVALLTGEGVRLGVSSSD
jgi:hypothetical protein